MVELVFRAALISMLQSSAVRGTVITRPLLLVLQLCAYIFVNL